ncbi:hypothetical protein CRG98_006567 [Punica granatum]|uniref:Uncharacterized protein n=1 Tax=Punica granatum TaxID=22663 RepID=A0A2I0KX71_PUNGR|nr:hypothetical protein CRG98_006567 [Punica granatum]
MHIEFPNGMFEWKMKLTWRMNFLKKKSSRFHEEYLEWVHRVDKVFECYEYSEAQKCQLAALEFTDYANLWVFVKESTQEIESEDEGVDEEVSGDAQGEYVEFADEGEMLMIRQVLSSETKLEEEQRENLFRTRCTIQNKVCRVIINSGSCTNVASTTLVEKLNLATTKHPCPYKLRWLNDRGEARVTQQVRIPVSIGKTYKD